MQKFSIFLLAFVNYIFALSVCQIFPDQSLQKVFNIFHPKLFQQCNIYLRSITKTLIKHYQIPQNNHKKQYFKIEYLNQQKIIGIYSPSYSGAVYGLFKIFEQLKQKGQVQLFQDQPLYEYRGIMIDTARHFISKQKIFGTLKAMSISRLNYLHWHIVDDQSFPLVQSLNLYKTGAYTQQQIYTKDDITQILQQAKTLGIEVIPQIDTPGHTRSWGLNNTYSQTVIQNCPNSSYGYNGQMDPSLGNTSILVNSVLKQISEQFNNSKYFHLGGRYVSDKCWDQRASIKEFMINHSLNTYVDLLSYWRNEIKKNIPSTQSTIFWTQSSENPNLTQTDIIQYIGTYNDAQDFLKNLTNKVILSPIDMLYLGNGKGNIYSHMSSGYIVWKHLYNSFIPQNFTFQDRILGAEAILFSETSNQQDLDNDLWVRSTVLGQILWNQNRLTLGQLVTVLESKRLDIIKIGVSPSPIISQWCQHNIKMCFGQ